MTRASSPLAQHEFEDGSRIVLTRQRHGAAYRVAYPGPAGLEVTQDFDAVRVQRNDIALLRECESFPKRQHSAGSLEGPPEAYGAVGRALALIEQGEEPELEVAVDG